MINLNEDFWSAKWKNRKTGWDIGEVSPPLKAYFEQLTNKSANILIPGCGAGYEGEYLHRLGFENVYLLDITAEALERFAVRVPDFPKEHLIQDDFFNLHEQKDLPAFDLIVEQTFFCAINPKLRDQYVEQSYRLLSDQGKLSGLLFDAELNVDHPPFGGTKDEYEKRFSSKFDLRTLAPSYNSIGPREGREVFIIAEKK